MSSLPAPDPALQACVVVPARDEEELVGVCLEALADQDGVACERYEVILVLDGCVDGTARRARAVAAAHPELRLRLRAGPGVGAGAARRAGMDLACARLLERRRPGGLIACTDADSIVDRGWLRAQLHEVARGARAIGGRIELLPADAAALGPGVLRRRAHAAAARYARVLHESSPAERRLAGHWQFSGASMAATAATYAQVGGIEPRPELEDESFERALRRHRVPIVRSLQVRVATSGRRHGRAARGLAHDLALADRLERGATAGRPAVVGRRTTAPRARHPSGDLPTIPPCPMS